MDKKRPNSETREEQEDFRKYAQDFEKQIKLAKDFIQRQAEEEGEGLSALEELTNPSQERLDRVFSETAGMAIFVAILVIYERGTFSIATVHIGYSDWPVEVAIDSTVAIYVLRELQVPLGLRVL